MEFSLRGTRQNTHISMDSTLDSGDSSTTTATAGTLHRIWIFPVKSLDGLSVPEARITGAGSLLHDREFALFDTQNRVVNAKRHEHIHLIRAIFQPASPLEVQLTAPDQPALTIDLNETADVTRAAKWFSDCFGFPVEIRRATETGFPDDTKRPGPTIISRASLAKTSSWLPPLTADQLAERFRANLEVAGVPAFWEDRLLAENGVPFHVGKVQMLGLNPCARCVVPTRDPRTAELHAGFSKTMTARRKAEIPTWAKPDLFSHYYRISTNTSIDATQAGRVLRVGDAVNLTQSGV